MKQQYKILITLIAFLSIFGSGMLTQSCTGLQKREIQKSEIEALAETSPDLALTAYCYRANQVRDSDAGQNVMVCDQHAKFYRQTQELKTCEAITHDACNCYKSIFNRGNDRIECKRPEIAQVNKDG